MTNRSHDDYLDYVAQELRLGRSLDVARLRARLRADINVEIDRQTMSRAQAHNAAGIPAGSLDRGTLGTETLRRVLDGLRALPGRRADLSFALGGMR